MQFAFCPYCGHKLDEDFAFCPKCGKKLNNVGAAAETSVDVSEQTDDLFGGSLGGNAQNGGLDNFSALGNILDGEIEKKNESDKKHRLIRVLCAREKFDEATALCNELIETEPEDLAAYIGFIRIESKDYSVFEGQNIDKAIKVAQKICGITENLSKFDAELALYLKNREKHFATKEQAAIKAEEERKAKAAAEKKAKEEAERKAKEEFEINGTTLVKYNKPNYNGKVTIPGGITAIGKEAFRYCQITGVIIPDSVTSIGERAFGWCYSLTSINIPNSVTSIASGVFAGCKSLTSINIPNSVTSIGFFLFSCCDSLEKVIYEGSSAEWRKISRKGRVYPKIYCKKDGVIIKEVVTIGD